MSFVSALFFWRPLPVAENNFRTFAASILDTAYGKRIHDMNDEYITAVKEGARGFSESRLPGKFWVEFLPFLKHVPAWVPGTAARKFGAYFRPYVERVRNDAFDEVKNVCVRSPSCIQIEAHINDA